MRTRASLSVAYMHTLYSTTSKYHSQEKEHDFIKFLIGPFLDLENGNASLMSKCSDHNIFIYSRVCILTCFLLLIYISTAVCNPTI